MMRLVNDLVGWVKCRPNNVRIHTNLCRLFAHRFTHKRLFQTIFPLWRYDAARKWQAKADYFDNI
jgi:hypothetical protein